MFVGIFSWYDKNITFKICLKIQPTIKFEVDPKSK